LAFVLISEAQNRDHDEREPNGREPDGRKPNDRESNDRDPNGRNPNGRDRPRRKWGQKKIFDDSCLPSNCDGIGFSILIETNATCPTNVTLKEIESQAVKKNEFCEAQNSKVCTYCVKIEFQVTSNECQMNKPEKCEKPKDIKNGQCSCSSTRYYGNHWNYGGGYYGWWIPFKWGVRSV